MTHATTTRTNKSRRAHPAVIRAALRARERLTKQTDGAPSQTTSNQYDRAGRLTQVTDPAGRTNGTTYN
ncbi:MAG: hypothetical protein GW908_11810, partial [Thiomicrospira sp.]|nr:hypothetical protein [Thiomicrospira sp.]